MKNLKIRSKLFILVGMLIVGLIALGMTSLSFMSKINGSSTILAENWLPSTIAAEELNTLTSDYRINEFAHIVAQDQKSMASYETEMERIKGEIDATFNNYTSNLATDDTDRSMMEDARAAWQEYLSIHDRMITLSRENQTQEAMRLVNGEAKTLFDQASATLLKVVNFNTEGRDPGQPGWRRALFRGAVYHDSSHYPACCGRSSVFRLCGQEHHFPG